MRLKCALNVRKKFYIFIIVHLISKKKMLMKQRVDQQEDLSFYIERVSLFMTLKVMILAHYKQVRNMINMMEKPMHFIASLIQCIMNPNLAWIRRMGCTNLFLIQDVI